MLVNFNYKNQGFRAVQQSEFKRKDKPSILLRDWVKMTTRVLSFYLLLFSDMNLAELLLPSIFTRLLTTYILIQSNFKL